MKSVSHIYPLLKTCMRPFYLPLIRAQVHRHTRMCPSTVHALTYCARPFPFFIVHTPALVCIPSYCHAHPPFVKHATPFLCTDLLCQPCPFQFKITLRNCVCPHHLYTPNHPYTFLLSMNVLLTCVRLFSIYTTKLSFIPPLGHLSLQLRRSG
jgi:hypothetical protein